MFEFFQGIADFFSTLIGFIVDTITGFINLITSAFTGMGFMMVAVAYLPDFVRLFVVALLGVAISKLIINMGGN